MNWTRDNWKTFVFALAVTVAVLVAGQFFWQKLAVAKPLETQLLHIKGVAAATWEESKSGDASLNITLADVDNLAATYGEIEGVAKKALGRKTAAIVLHDTRTPELESLFWSVSQHVQEAVFTGRFAAMSDRIAVQARSEGADARVWVDARHVYLRLAKNGAVLYSVMPRPETKAEVR